MILHWLGEMFDPALRGYWGPPTFRPHTPFSRLFELADASGVLIDPELATRRVKR